MPKNIVSEPVTTDTEEKEAPKTTGFDKIKQFARDHHQALLILGPVAVAATVYFTTMRNTPLEEMSEDV